MKCISLVDEIAPKKAAIFLDDVQEVDEWQRLVRSLLDRGRTVCVTGSNASLLGRELGAKLTGRHVSFELFPFSYTEYLAYTRQKPGAVSFAAFLDDGGFPAYLRERDPRILQGLLRDIVQRDIAIRHALRETRHVMNLVLFLLANTGQPFSMHSLTKALAIPAVAQTSRYLGIPSGRLPPVCRPEVQRVVQAPRRHPQQVLCGRQRSAPRQLAAGHARSWASLGERRLPRPASARGASRLRGREGHMGV